MCVRVRVCKLIIFRKHYGQRGKRQWRVRKEGRGAAVDNDLHTMLRAMQLPLGPIYMHHLLVLTHPQRHTHPHTHTHTHMHTHVSPQCDLDLDTARQQEASVAQAFLQDQ